MDHDSMLGPGADNHAVDDASSYAHLVGDDGTGLDKHTHTHTQNWKNQKQNKQNKQNK
jgi:hypothetical protein